MAVAQWGLGCYERYLSGEGEAWLAGAVAACEHLVQEQKPAGDQAGGWFEPYDYPHTFHVRGPWLSAMAQGQCASLLVRIHCETAIDRFAEAANRGLAAAAVPTAELDGRPFPEEYPTDPPAFVLNGAFFALWGYYDVSTSLHDSDAERIFRDILDTLTSNIHRWDTGYWSLYDLYPHPIANVASSWYHTLHSNQLRATSVIAPRPELQRTLAAFEAYAASPWNRRRAFAQKVVFRLLVPRNRFLARRLPWLRPQRRS